MPSIFLIPFAKMFVFAKKDLISFSKMFVLVKEKLFGYDEAI